jgi:hypothetical protein
VTLPDSSPGSRHYTPAEDAPLDVLKLRIETAMTYPHGHPGVRTPVNGGERDHRADRDPRPRPPRHDPPRGPPVTAALLLVVGVAIGAVMNELWKDILELLELYREQR